MLGFSRRLRLSSSVRATSTERETLAAAINALAPAQAALDTASAAVAVQRELLAAVESATSALLAAEAALRQFASSHDTGGAIRGRAAELLDYHANVDRAKQALATALANAQGAEEALAAAEAAESEARSALAAVEQQVADARDTVLFAEYVQRELERFVQASKVRNEAARALHAIGYAAWPVWGGDRFKSSAIHGPIVQAFDEYSLALPDY